MASKALEHFYKAEEEIYQQLIRVQNFITEEGGQPKHPFGSKIKVVSPTLFDNNSKNGKGKSEYEHVIEFMMKKPGHAFSKSEIKEGLKHLQEKINVGRSLRYLKEKKKQVEIVGEKRGAKWREDSKKLHCNTK